MYNLTKHEELILVAIWKLRDNAYIVTIRQHIRSVSQRAINYGSLCNTLATLHRKGYVKSRESEPVSQPGGRRKVLYVLTLDGKRALNQAFEIQKLTWNGFAGFVLES